MDRDARWGLGLLQPLQVPVALSEELPQLCVRGLASAELPDLRIEAREIWLSGEASPKARREIEALGIRLVQRVFETMVPRLAGETQ